jgi:hypothetical protein
MKSMEKSTQTIGYIIGGSLTAIVLIVGIYKKFKKSSNTTSDSDLESTNSGIDEDKELYQPRSHKNSDVSDLSDRINGGKLKKKSKKRKIKSSHRHKKSLKRKFK